MVQKSMIIPLRRRELKAPFAWLDRRFLFNGFLARITSDEALLYFFLCLVADRDGLSFYSYDKICQLLKLDLDSYLRARDGLIWKNLIAFSDNLFQVLSLPEPQEKKQPKRESHPERGNDFKSAAQIFSRLAQHHNPSLS